MSKLDLANLSTRSSCDSPSTLLKLPDDVLTGIFRRCQPSEICQPICRRLLPLTRKLLYSQIYIDSVKKAEQLVQTLQEDKQGSLAPMIRKLEVQDGGPNSQGASTVLVKLSTLLPPSAKIHLVSVDKLSSLDQTLDTVYDPSVSEIRPPPLHSLKLWLDQKKDQLSRDPFNPSTLERLSRFPSLKYLELLLFEAPSTPVDPSSFDQSPDINLTHLRLKFNEPNITPATVAFIRHCPNLTHLTIDVNGCNMTGRKVTQSTLLQLLSAAPTTLKSLFFSSSEGLGPCPKAIADPSAIIAEICRFTGLETLRLESWAFKLLGSAKCIKAITTSFTNLRSFTLRDSLQDENIEPLKDLVNARTTSTGEEGGGGGATLEVLDLRDEAYDKGPSYEGKRRNGETFEFYAPMCLPMASSIREIRKLVNFAKERGVKVVLGGSEFPGRVDGEDFEMVYEDPIKIYDEYGGVDRYGNLEGSEEESDDDEGLMFGR